MKTADHILRKRYGLLTLAVALTLLVRLVYGLVVFDRIADRYSWRLDDEYSDIASTVITSGKYALSETSPPTMRRLPAHPLFLAAIYATFGRSPVAVRIFQTLLCAITCVLVYLTAREVTNERVAGIASLFFALYPNSILYSARTLSETTYSLLLSAFCLTLVRQFKSPGIRTSIATGLAFGTLLLTKSTTLLLPPFLLLTLLSVHYRKKLWRAIGSAALAVFVAVLVISPWAIRNYKLTGRMTVLSTWGGAPFYHGYYLATHLLEGRSGFQLDHDAAQERRRLVDERYTPSGQPIDEYYQDKITYSLVWKKIKARPLYSFGIFLRNVFLTWFLTYGHLTTIISFFVHMPLLLLTGYAVLVMPKRDPGVWIKTLPLLLVVVYFDLFHAIVYPHARYMAPVTGTIVTILAAYSVSHLLSLAGPLRARYVTGNPRKAGPRRS